MVRNRTAPRSRLTSKGQTTIPVEVRRALSLAVGDSITYEVEGDKVVLRKQPSIMELAGILRDRAIIPPPAPEEVREAVRRHRVAAWEQKERRSR